MLWLVGVPSACTCEAEEAKPVVASLPSARSRIAVAPPRVLFLPEAGAPLDVVFIPKPPSPRVTSCPPEMVNIAGAFCIDRYEATLVDIRQKRRVSPYYHPTVTHTRSAYEIWERERRNMGEPQYQQLPLPRPPAFQLRENFDIEARVQRGAVPNGYLNQRVARRACENAGKRLCTEEEWVRACRGERDRDFPYGESYRQGVCNVFNGAHPAGILHGNFSVGHLDPRLNQFSYEGSPLLHSTGSHPECASRWGNDAVYDMVGNLDEWVDDEEGVFVGGFYARGTRDGCASRIGSHPPAYFDYSLGVRCCK